MKKTVAIFLTAAMIFLFCSCGLARDMAQKVKDEIQKSDAGQGVPFLPETPAEKSLPPLPTEVPNQMMPEDEDAPDEIASEEFALMADPEGVISGGKIPKLDEVEQDMFYSYQPDMGAYQKDTAFMGKDGSVELTFDMEGRNRYINYWYTGERAAVNAQQICSEFDYLYQLAKEKYGKITIHTWLINPSKIVDNFTTMGEFDEEEITDAVNENSVADFYYAWSRPGNSALYAYLSLAGDGTYQVGLSYDRSGPFSPEPNAFL